VSSKDTQLAVLGSSLDQYMAEVNRFPLLSREEEQELAQKLVDDGDVEAAQRLVTANLRFVVKVAYEYRNYNVKLVDLVQEGNIGLMKAVRRFNPDRGYRLISYAVWWIRAYMQNYIIKNWSMVKIGATAANRKMLFGKKDPLREDNEKRETFLVPAMSTLSATDAPDPAASIARKDFHLDASMDDEGGGSYTEMLADRSWEDPDEEISRSQTIEFVSERLEEALEQLNERQRFILQHRLLADEPMTLQEIGDQYGISRERARQLEAALKKKLAGFLTGFDEESGDIIDV